jgi:hypothetical protein
MKCKFCKKDTENPKFCDKSCAAKFNNKKYPKRIAVSNSCLSCNKPITAYKKYCNQSCQSDYVFETETRLRVESGLVTSATTLKNYLTRIVGYECIVCENKGKHLNKPLTLQLDHIDGNSDNNLPSNLRFLCPNCHSQTETFVTRQKKDTKRNRYLRKFKGY